MQTQKIVNLLNGSDIENSKFATKKWCVINDESKGNNSSDDEIKFLMRSLESSLCDYSDAYILVTGNITVAGGNANKKVAFKNCAPFKERRTEINETLVDKTEYINIAMPMYNLTEYSNNYSDTSGSLSLFKRDELNIDDINSNLADDNAASFKYNASINGNATAGGDNSKKNDVKLAVPLKYLSNFQRSSEMPLIKCKVELSLEWYTKCVLIIGNGTHATFAVTDTKLYVPVVFLKTEDNAKLSKLLNEGLVYWNNYKIILKDYAANEKIRERLDASFQKDSGFFCYCLSTWW